MKLNATIGIAIVLCALIGQAACAELQNKTSEAGQPLFEELATRLLEAGYPGTPELNKVQLVVGEISENMPVDLPIPDGARVIGSEVREGIGIRIVLDVPMTPDQTLDFYRNNLDSEKWTETEYPENQMLGFILNYSSAIFCQGTRNPWLTVSAYPLDNVTDLRLDIINDISYSPCSVTGGDYSIRPIPKLLAPKGARQYNEYYAGGDGNQVEIAAILETEMNSTSLADYYADQLKAANWTQEDSGQSGPLSWSSWKVEDEDSLIWNGIMIALKLPEAANRTFVMVRASQEDN